jgi:hypothetical protein
MPSLLPLPCRDVNPRETFLPASCLHLRDARRPRLSSISHNGLAEWDQAALGAWWHPPRHVGSADPGAADDQDGASGAVEEANVERLGEG